VADTERRYDLPRLGLPSRPQEADLLRELRRSARHLTTGMVCLYR
jgi:hypothetical protein